MRKMIHKEQTFNTVLNGKNVLCTIYSYEEFSNEHLLSFDYNNKHYTFDIIKNRPFFIDTLIKYVHEFNDLSFGFYDYENVLNMNYQQKKSFREKIARDFMVCLNYYIEKYPSNLLTTAVILHGDDYFEHKSEENYSKCIEKEVCRFIIERKFVCKTRFVVAEWKSTIDEQQEDTDNEE